jgi:hypothetical protein
MKLLRFVKRAALVVALGAVILLVGFSACLRIGQYRFRRQAERLLSDVRELELEKASAAQAKVIISKWGFEKWQRPDRPCTEDDCAYRFESMAGPVGLHEFRDPFLWRSMAGLAEWFGLRPTRVDVWLQIQGETLRSVSFSVYTIGRGCGERGCVLASRAGTKQEGGSWSSRDQPEVKLKHSLSHPNYLVGTFPTLFNVDTGGSPAVVIWAEFTPEASTADVSRLMQFDLSCLTRLRACENLDLMPTVWAQSLVDNQQSPESLTCTPDLSRRVAQLADVIAVVRPQTVELSSPPYKGRTSQLRNLEVVDVIKKPEYPKRLARLDVDVGRPQMMMPADTGSPMRAGQEYVFLLQVRSDPSIEWFALYPCGVLSLNDANLAMVREAAPTGSRYWPPPSA